MSKNYIAFISWVFVVIFKRYILKSFFILFSLQGYHGCAIGKAKQNAKTEIEKLKVIFFIAKIAILNSYFVKNTFYYLLIFNHTKVKVA